MITLTNETVFLLKTLYTQIDIELDKHFDECNMDIVSENQIKIYTTVKNIIFKEEEE